MAEDTPIYLLNLADVGSNSATFAVFTQYVRKVDSIEVRAPSYASKQRCDDAFYTLDKAANLIDDWRKLYTWLGRGRGWAAFTPDSAAELVPHWLGPSVEYHCVNLHGGPIEFVESTLLHELATTKLSWELAGTGMEGDGPLRLENIRGNMVASKRPLFISAR